MRIEKAWKKKGPVAIVLWPVSVVYQLLSAIRRELYTRGLKTVVSNDKLPVIVIGNITVGGTGKSPLVAHMVQESLKRGFKPGIVSRGYGGQTHLTPHLVQLSDTAATVGDEPMMLFEQTGVPVSVCTRRAEAVRLLAENTSVDVVISDDGLQHLAMDRQIEIVVIDSERRFGNGYLLPAGPLRESVSRLNTVDLVVEQLPAGVELPADKAAFQLKPSAVVSLDDGKVMDLAEFAGSTVHAIAGIGNPERFFNSLRSAGIEVITHSLNDHHEYCEGDLLFEDDLMVLVTRKDAVKIKQLSGVPSKIHVVEVQLVANPVLHQAIDDFLNDVTREHLP